MGNQNVNVSCLWWGGQTWDKPQFLEECFASCQHKLGRVGRHWVSCSFLFNKDSSPKVVSPKKVEKKTKKKKRKKKQQESEKWGTSVETEGISCKKTITLTLFELRMDLKHFVCCFVVSLWKLLHIKRSVQHQSNKFLYATLQRGIISALTTTTKKSVRSPPANTRNCFWNQFAAIVKWVSVTMHRPDRDCEGCALRQERDEVQS